MSALFRCLDYMPIVRMLQLVAILCFFIALFNLVLSLVYHKEMSPVLYSYQLDPSVANLKDAILTVQNHLYYLFLEPIVLLGLAEIIRLMKEKKEEK